jgi:hypothetical protein
MEEEKGNYIERPEDRFSMDGILQSLGGFAKNTAGRYIGSQALGGAGGMLFGPIGGLVGGIIGALKGGNLFNQNTYSQQMYNNLTSQGQGYVDRLYGPGGVLQGYNQFSAFGKGALGTIANNLSKYPNMSPARRNVYRTAADKYIDSIDPTKQGYNAVTKKGTVILMMMHILTMHHLLVTEILAAEGLKVLETVLIQIKQLYNYG